MSCIHWLIPDFYPSPTLISIKHRASSPVRWTPPRALTDSTGNRTKGRVDVYKSVR